MYVQEKPNQQNRRECVNITKDKSNCENNRNTIK